MLQRKSARNMQKKYMYEYAQICKLYAIICIDPTIMDLKRKYALNMH